MPPYSLKRDSLFLGTILRMRVFDHSWTAMYAIMGGMVILIIILFVSKAYVQSAFDK